MTEGVGGDSLVARDGGYVWSFFDEGHYEDVTRERSIWNEWRALGLEWMYPHRTGGLASRVLGKGKRVIDSATTMSDYWDTEANVDTYEKLAEGYDGRELVAYLREVLAEQSTVLELGMGPGKDLDLLRETFKATGSDRSQVFVDRYLSRNPGADVLRLDAVELATDRSFDAIYSNKVLQHLTRDQMRRSLARQVQIVRAGGILLHAVWYGDNVEEHHGLLFTQYTEELLHDVLPDELEIVAVRRYGEMEAGDSLLVHLRRS